MATTHPAKQPVKRTARRSTKRAAKLAATGSATAAEKIAADSKKRRSARRRGSSRKSPRQATKPEKKVFVLTLPLRTSKEDERKILGNLEIIRQIYNASLGEALKRLKRLRGSPEWKAACLLPKQVLGKDGKQHQNEERTAAFRAAHAKFGFTKSAIETFAIECKNRGGFLDRLGAPETQRMAERAFSAVQQYAFGARGRPRFKGLRGIHSLEGKSAAASLRWRDGHLCYGGMKLKALVEEKDQYACEALSRKLKYCRLLRKTIKGRFRFYVQLVLDGHPPRREAVQIGKGRVGMDQGPSNLATVAQPTPDAPATAHLVRFCATIDEPWAETRRLRRKVDRSRRATNPQNYDAKGKVKRGPKKWTMSTRGQRVQRVLAEVERKLAAERERCHGHLGNDILRLGDEFNWEKVSYKSFQKCYGRSVKVRAPGAFFDRFERKADSAGAKTNEFSTYTTKLSQYCHMRKDCVKKPLSQRRHVFPDGTWVDRDLYSAWLACSVQGDELDATRAEEAWAAAQLPLRTASMLAKTTQPASARGLPRTTPAEKTRPTSERVVRDREVRGAYHPGGRGANGVKEPRAEGDGSGYVRREGLSTRLPNPASRGAGAEPRSFTTG